MGTNHEQGTNPRGTTITYKVFRAGAAHAQQPAFTYEAKRYTQARVLRECRNQGVSGRVVVSWWRAARWGLDMQTREVVV